MDKQLVYVWEIPYDSSMPRSPGVELALLLLDGFHSMTDDVRAELADRGHPGVRAGHEFTLRAIDAGADTASELGRRLSITKQAAAQAIAVLEQLGYVGREADPGDARVKRLQVTPRGHEMMTLGAGLFDEIRDRWAAQIGAGELDALQAHLAQLTALRSLTADDLL
ncbi:MAG TPA: MarR family transcriptional regulator [Trebonia sp.]